MNIAANRINGIIRKTGAARYLEIGVCEGTTFFAVDAPFKVAVDPDFRFDISEHEADGTYFFPLPSDEFFAVFEASQAAERLRNGGAVPLFDVIYIDGLHTFEQAYRDFINSCRYAHEKTVWIFDDTVPNDPYSALPDLDLCAKYRAMAGVASESWHGDVYKAVLTLHDRHKDIFYRTLLDGRKPQTVAWRAAGRASARADSCTSFEAIGELGYFDMAERAAVLHIGENADLLDILHTPVESGLVGEDAAAAFFYERDLHTKTAAFLLKENTKLKRQVEMLRKELARRS